MLPFRIPLFLRCLPRRIPRMCLIAYTAKWASVQKEMHFPFPIGSEVKEGVTAATGVSLARRPTVTRGHILLPHRRCLLFHLHRIRFHGRIQRVIPVVGLWFRGMGETTSRNSPTKVLFGRTLPLLPPLRREDFSL